VLHHLGIPPGTRTPTNGFGDHRAAITPERYIWYPWVGTIHLPIAYQAIALPMSYMGKLVQPVGIEPTSMVLQTTAMTTSAKVALGCLMRIELIRRESQSLMLPLHHRHHRLAEVVRFELTARY
jgi:hypothetical protein